ncbi:MAG: nicotinate (nicotinamide) nucleotide adenylyltransferase [Salinivirgaceae bacterium]|nr:nicotinate (nicotinamide) nucleotide adenylyltransferase [Salinivirgaceae bacterium]MDD4748038.1 nicotinate (nicotinamide) nucleotide adenylyltransferase [Salinivirgaceae bacterium]MDY0279516.1 nicotinate (nicotinamide) nucleotide adenylyltransferase [Salinivirgaceae bacterium]
MSVQKTTGLFFGTFNPIHIGHMAIANYIKSFANMDELWFIVSPQSPFKKHQTISDDRHRLEMVRQAIGNTPGYRASDVEFQMPTPSYTIDTIVYLNEKHPRRKFSLIMGADNLEQITKWKNYEELLKRCPIFVYPRPGHSVDVPAGANITVVNAPLMEISSSFIRKAVQENREIPFFLPQGVWEYIEKMNLYR